MIAASSDGLSAAVKAAGDIDHFFALAAFLNPASPSQFIWRGITTAITLDYASFKPSPGYGYFGARKSLGDVQPAGGTPF